MRIVLTTLLGVLLLVGCSSKPVLPTEGVERELTPKQVVDSDSEMSGSRVLWGGVIVSSRNLEQRSLIEVVSYPLDSSLRPQSDKQAGQRFLIYQQGYLETVDYAAGRRLSVVGTLSGIEEGRLGEHHYRYPAVEAEQLHLWPLEQQKSEPKVRFGIGVIFHN